MEIELDWSPGDSEKLLRYSNFMQEHGSSVGYVGKVVRGEIMIVTDPENAMKCVLTMRERLVKQTDLKTGERRWSNVQIVAMTRLGIVYEDQYAFMVRFPVFFPPAQGKTDPVPGLYITWFWRALFGQMAAACGMPVMPDGRIALVKAFRHTTREWVIEFPRGGLDIGSGVLLALKRELGEEAGLSCGEVIHLGDDEPDNGLMSSVVPVFLVRVQGVGEAHPEYAEAISGLATFTVAEFEKLLVDQKWEHDGRVYRLRGSFENFAWNQARLRGLI